MILNHLWGLYAHPKNEWHSLDTQPENISHTLAHLLLVALIWFFPAIVMWLPSLPSSPR